MELDLPTTLVLLALGCGLFGFAGWRASRPPDPGNVRMINYHVVQIFTIIFILLILAHVVTLVTGHPLVGG